MLSTVNGIVPRAHSVTGDKLWFGFSHCQVDQTGLGKVPIQTDNLGVVVVVEGA